MTLTADFVRRRSTAPWLWLAPAVVGAGLTGLVMVFLPPDRTLHGFGDFLLKVSPLLCAVLTIALFPVRRGWAPYLALAGFIAYFGYLDSASFIQIDRLVSAAQADATHAEFNSYYRFSIFVNAFVLLFGVCCFRLGGGSSAMTMKLGSAGMLVLISGLNDLTMWAMYDWPGGVRPQTFDWASHVSIFLGREPGLRDMLAFLAVHVALIVLILRLPLEKWLASASAADRAPQHQ